MDAGDACRSAAQTLRLVAHAVTVGGRVEALRRRMLASCCSVEHFISLCKDGLDKMARETVHAGGAAARQMGKEWDAAAEEARTRAAQLDYCSYVLEASDVAEVAVTTARALLSMSYPDRVGLLRVAHTVASLFHAADCALYLRDGVDVAQCVLNGSESRIVPGGEGVVCFTAVGNDGDRVDTIEAEDVCVSVAGGTVMSVEVIEAGRVEVRYQADMSGVGVMLAISVCGAAAPLRFPFPLHDSLVLFGVSAGTRAAFVRKLVTEWLVPASDSSCEFNLLYRGSRDGLTQQAVYDATSTAPRVLYLILADNGQVFGGYTCVKLHKDTLVCRTSNSFAFDVASSTRRPMDNTETWIGPGISMSHCWYGPGGFVLTYEDGPIDRRGCYSFVGSTQTQSQLQETMHAMASRADFSARFTPLEMEVFSVTHTASV